MMRCWQMAPALEQPPSFGLCGGRRQARSRVGQPACLLSMVTLSERGLQPAQLCFSLKVSALW
jgi:hypothetical protein